MVVILILCLGELCVKSKKGLLLNGFYDNLRTASNEFTKGRYVPNLARIKLKYYCDCHCVSGLLSMLIVNQFLRVF